MEESFAVRTPTVSEVMEECVQHWYRRIQKVLLRALSTPQKITCTRSPTKDRPNARGWILGNVAEQLNELRSRLEDVDLPSEHSEDTLVCQCSLAQNVTYFGQLKLARLAVVMSIVEKMDGLLSEILDADLNHDFCSSARGPISSDVQIGGDEQKLLYECVLFRTPDKSDAGQFRIVYMIFVQSERAYGGTDSVQVFKREYRPGNDEMALYRKLVCTPLNTISNPISTSNIDPNPIIIEDADVSSDTSTHKPEEIVTIDLTNLQFLRRNSLIIINEDGPDVLIEAPASLDNKPVIEKSEVIEIADDSKRGTFEKSTYGPFKLHPRRQECNNSTRRTRSPLKGARKVFGLNLKGDEDGYVFLQRRQKSDENNSTSRVFNGRLKKLARKNRAYRLDKAKTVRALWKRSRLRRAQQENLDPRLLKLRKGVRRFSRRRKAKFGTICVDFKDGDFKLRHREVTGMKTGSAKIFGRFFRVLSRFGRLRTGFLDEFDCKHDEVLWSETFHVEDRFTYVVVEDPGRGCFVGKEVEGQNQRKVQSTSSAVTGHSTTNDESRDCKRSKKEESNRTDDGLGAQNKPGGLNSMGSNSFDEESYQEGNEIDENGNNLPRGELVDFSEESEHSKKAINDSSHKKQEQTGIAGSLNNAANENTLVNFALNPEKRHPELVPKKKRELDDESSKIPSSKEYNQLPKSARDSNIESIATWHKDTDSNLEDKNTEKRHVELASSKKHVMEDETSKIPSSKEHKKMPPSKSEAKYESTAVRQCNRDSHSNLEGDAVIQGLTKKRTRIKSTSIELGCDPHKKDSAENEKYVELNRTFIDKGNADEIRGIESTSKQCFGGNVGLENGSSEGVYTKICVPNVDKATEDEKVATTDYFSRNLGQKDSSSRTVCTNYYAKDVEEKKKGTELTSNFEHDNTSMKEPCSLSFIDKITGTSKDTICYKKKKLDVNREMYTKTCAENLALDKEGIKSKYVVNIRPKNTTLIQACTENVAVDREDIKSSYVANTRLKNTTLIKEGTTNTLYDNNNFVRMCKKDSKEDKMSYAGKKNVEFITVCDDNKNVTIYETDLSESNNYIEKIAEQNLLEETERIKEKMHERFLDCSAAEPGDFLELFLELSEQVCTSDRLSEEPDKLTAPVDGNFERECSVGSKNLDLEMSNRKGSFIETLEGVNKSDPNEYIEARECLAKTDLKARGGTMLGEVTNNKVYRQENQERNKDGRSKTASNSNADLDEVNIHELNAKSNSEIQLLNSLERQVEHCDEFSIRSSADGSLLSEPDGQVQNCDEFTEPIVLSSADLSLSSEPEIVSCEPGNNQMNSSKKDQICAVEEDVITITDSSSSSFTVEQEDILASEADVANPFSKIIYEEIFCSSSEINTELSDAIIGSSSTAKQRDMAASESDFANEKLDPNRKKISLKRFLSDGTILSPEDSTCSSVAEQIDSADLENSFGKIVDKDGKVKISSTPELAEINCSSTVNADSNISSTSSSTKLVDIECSGDADSNGFFGETNDDTQFPNEKNRELEVTNEETQFGSNSVQFVYDQMSVTEDSVPKLKEISSSTADLRGKKVEVSFVNLFSSKTHEEKIAHATHIDNRGRISEDGLSSLVVGDDTHEQISTDTNTCSKSSNEASFKQRDEITSKCLSITSPEIDDRTKIGYSSNETSFQQGDEEECISILSPEIEDSVTNDKSSKNAYETSTQQEVHKDDTSERMNVTSPNIEDLDDSEVSLEQLFSKRDREGLSQKSLKSQPIDLEDSSSCAPLEKAMHSEIGLKQPFSKDDREGSSQKSLKIQSTDVEDPSSCVEETNLAIPKGCNVETNKIPKKFQSKTTKDDDENLKGEIIESLKLLKVRRDSVPIMETRNSSKEGYWEIVKDCTSKNGSDTPLTGNSEPTKVFQAAASSKRTQVGNTSKKGPATTSSVKDKGELEEAGKTSKKVTTPAGKDKKEIEANNITLLNRQKHYSPSVSTENLSSSELQKELERHVEFIHDYIKRDRPNNNENNNQDKSVSNSTKECLSSENCSSKETIVHNKNTSVENSVKVSIPITKSLMLRIPLDKVTLPEDEYYVESEVPNPLKLKINRRRSSDGRRSSAETLEDGLFYELLQKNSAVQKGTHQESNAKCKKEETPDYRAAPKIKILTTKNGFQTVLDDPLMDQSQTKTADSLGTTDESKICVRKSERILKSKNTEAPVQKIKQKVGRPRRGDNSMTTLLRTTRYRVLKRKKLEGGDDSNFEPPRSTKVIDGNVSPIQTRSKLRAREGEAIKQTSISMSLRRNARHLNKAIVEFELEGSPPKRRKRGQRKGRKEKAKDVSQEPKDVIDLTIEENDPQTTQEDIVPLCQDDLPDTAIDLSKTSSNYVPPSNDKKIEPQGKAETGLPFKKRRLSIETMQHQTTQHQTTQHQTTQHQSTQHQTTQHQIERNTARTSEISYPAQQMLSIAEVHPFCNNPPTFELMPIVPFYPPPPYFVHFPFPYMDPRGLY